MTFVVNLPLFCIVACLLCAVTSSILRGTAARIVSLCLTSCVCVCSLLVLIYVNRSGNVTYLMGHYPHPWGNELRLGTLEALFSAVFSAVLFLCMLGGRKQLLRDLSHDKQHLYYVMTDLIQAALLVLVYTNDIFTGYVFIEICTIASCGILMIRQIGRTTLASVRYMIFSLIGSGLFLFGVVILYNITGHLLMPNLKEAVAGLWKNGAYRVPLIASLSLIMIGLSIKSGLFPFHFWMPDTYGAATPCSSGILSGLVSKGYIFFLIKIVFDVFGTEVFYGSGVQNIFYVFGVLGMVIGSVSAMRENDIFRMTAYSSAAQIGYIYMGIGISPTLGVTAALFHILTHAVTKPALFLSAAQLSDTAGGSKRFKDLQGSAHSNRLAGAAFAVGALSMIGLPLTMGFISKYLFAISAFNANVKLIPTLIALAVSTILNTFYFTRTLIRLLNRPEGKEMQTVHLSQQRAYAVSAVILAAMNIAAGIAAQPLCDLLTKGLELF